jgi:hypothetical protein
MAINTSTVVLLVILAFLIYVFTSGTECVTDVYSMGTSPSNSDNQAYNSLLSQQLQISQNAMAVAQQSEQARQSSLLQDEAPQTQESTRTGDAVPNVFDYSGISDSGMLNVADLDSAFEKPIPKDANPNVVDTNKNNVENGK